MGTISFKAAQRRRANVQLMVDECCSMSQRAALAYLNRPPQQYFSERRERAKAISDDLMDLASIISFDIDLEECRSFGAIIAAWPHTELFNKALLTFRFEHSVTNDAPSYFIKSIDQHVASLNITRQSLDGLLTACLLAFTCYVGDVYIESLETV